MAEQLTIRRVKVLDREHIMVGPDRPHAKMLFEVIPSDDPQETEARAHQVAALPVLLAALRDIIAKAPAEQPEPARDDYGCWRSFGNADDVARDAVNEALWEVAQIAHMALAKAGV